MNIYTQSGDEEVVSESKEVNIELGTVGSQLTINKGSNKESHASITDSKKRKMSKKRKNNNASALSLNKTVAQKKEEEEFARLRESHNKSLAKNNSSM